MLNNSKGKRRRREERDKDGGRNEVEGKRKGEAGRGGGGKRRSGNQLTPSILSQHFLCGPQCSERGGGGELDKEPSLPCVPYVAEASFELLAFQA